MLNAVVSKIAEGLCRAATHVAKAAGISAPKKLTRMAGILVEAARDQRGPLAHFHRNEHRRLHDEMTRAVIRRMAPVVADVIRQGIKDGAFTTAYPDEAAVMALGCTVPLGLDLLFPDDADLERMVKAALDFILKGLGYSGRSS